MKAYLMFRLYGPLAAWGRVAVGEVRGSDVQPSKSAVLGLVAAALGLRRSEEEAQRRLVEGYGFAVRVDAPGILLRDYHTSQVPGRAQLRKRPHYTRRDELAVAREDLNTILSFREYRCDAGYTVALWALEGAPHTLETLRDALERPRFVLYLGRKSCPPALPLAPRVVTAPRLADAFTAAVFTDPDPALPKGRDEPGLYWEDDLDPTAEGLAALMTVKRRDRSLSRRRWQFAERFEVRGRLAGQGDEEG